MILKDIHSKAKKHKKILTGVAVAMLASAVVACGSGNDSTGGGTATITISVANNSCTNVSFDGTCILQAQYSNIPAGSLAFTQALTGNLFIGSGGVGYGLCIAAMVQNPASGSCTISVDGVAGHGSGNFAVNLLGNCSGNNCSTVALSNSVPISFANTTTQSVANASNANENKQSSFIVAPNRSSSNSSNQ